MYALPAPTALAVRQDRRAQRLTRFSMLIRVETSEPVSQHAKRGPSAFVLHKKQATAAYIGHEVAKAGDPVERYPIRHADRANFHLRALDGNLRLAPALDRRGPLKSDRFVAGFQHDRESVLGVIEIAL